MALNLGSDFKLGGRGEREIIIKAQPRFETIVVAEDGTGDYDTIQDALNELTSDGGSIFIKEGTYTISSSLEIKQDGTELIGAGQATIINVDSAIAIIDAKGKNRVVIRDIKFTGNAGAGNIGILMQINSSANKCFRCEVRDCYFEGIGGVAIKVALKAADTGAHLEGTKIINNYIQSTGSCIMLDADVGGVPTAEWHILNALISGNNLLNSNGVAGIELRTDDDGEHAGVILYCNIIGNMIEDDAATVSITTNSNGAANVDQVQNILVLGNNTFVDGSGNGGVTDAGSHNVVANNVDSGS